MDRNWDLRGPRCLWLVGGTFAVYGDPETCFKGCPGDPQRIRYPLCLLHNISVSCLYDIVKYPETLPISSWTWTVILFGGVNPNQPKSTRPHNTVCRGRSRQGMTLQTLAQLDDCIVQFAQCNMNRTKYSQPYCGTELNQRQHRTSLISSEEDQVGSCRGFVTDVDLRRSRATQRFEMIRRLTAAWFPWFRPDSAVAQSLPFGVWRCLDVWRCLEEIVWLILSFTKNLRAFDEILHLDILKKVVGETMWNP